VITAVFGPAPKAAPKKHNRLDDLFADEVYLKKRFLEKKGFGHAHSLDDELDEPVTFTQTINEYFT
jgi:hypothetical protein